jgi:hypothetical protein
MKNKIILSDMRTNRQGFNRIAELNNNLIYLGGSSTDPETIIEIDMSKVNWIDAHLAVPILLVVRKFESLFKGRIFYSNIKPMVQSVLQRNGFFANKLADKSGTTIPVTEFPTRSSTDFSKFAKDHLSRQEMPNMSQVLEDKFYEGVDEIYENASLHSKSFLNLCAGGQFYPKKGRLDFALVDGGIGYSGAYKSAFSSNISCIDAIEWALSDYNTTRQGDIPGGLGTKIVREFVKLNGGRYIIVSNFGYWSEDKGQTERATLKYAFPGTIVILEINTDDKSSYKLGNVPDPRDIW